ncbi:type IV toxin-antitoxin system AbiEi family antitoxin domain-containing protein [Nocardia bovistercoris]|uniref:AbiEi antitoxin C-terminal domain-containing protein n=1 Tax=Nocardia bovistercoris TaxID=2785916 RepID=A0A931IAT7_9NOCA|nr:hypothetical protein [Nocardia bovistercoris]MBH0777596.1 hypothetical protein [Nocardia bovistercoris]
MLEALYHELSILAAQQLGLITRAQAARIGADGAAVDALREAKLLRELDDDVFQLPSSPTALRYAYPYAAWLALDPERFGRERPQAPSQDAVVSHESAARLHGIGVLALPRTVFTAPAAPAYTPRAVVVHIDRLELDDVTSIGGIPVTTAHRTVVDLVRDAVGPDDIGRVLDDALRRDLLDLRAVHDALVPFADEFGFPANGAAFIDHFLPDIDPSTLSTRNLRAYADLVAPDEVAEVAARIARLLGEIRAPEDIVTTLGDDIAAEIVGRLRST